MDTESQLAPLEDACTVVLLRDGDAGLETLMLERPSTSRAFGGAWVFPGGKVDPEDRVGRTGRPLDDFTAAQVAGVRELAEETGQQLPLDELVWLSQWTPMQSIPRRFRTWFMLAPAASELVVLNPEEHERHSWLSPARALARHAEGGMKLVPPTWVTLHHLVGIESVEQALAAARNTEPFAFNTHLLMPDAGTCQGAPGPGPGPEPVAATALPSVSGIRPAGVLWAGDEEYPASPGTPAARPGARHRLNTRELPWTFERTSC